MVLAKLILQRCLSHFRLEKTHRPAEIPLLIRLGGPRPEVERTARFIKQTGL